MITALFEARGDARLERVIELQALRLRQPTLAGLTATFCVAALFALLAVGTLGGASAWADTTTDTTGTPVLTTTVEHTVTVASPPVTETVTEHTTSVIAAVTPTTPASSSGSGSTSSPPWWAWLLIGIGVVLLVMGIFALGRHSSRHHQPGPPGQPPPDQGAS
jgi:hypothetical protein